jgi:hypothetical protein
VLYFLDFAESRETAKKSAFSEIFLCVRSPEKWKSGGADRFLADAEKEKGSKKDRPGGRKGYFAPFTLVIVPLSMGVGGGNTAVADPLPVHLEFRGRRSGGSFSRKGRTDTCKVSVLTPRRQGRYLRLGFMFSADEKGNDIFDSCSHNRIFAPSQKSCTRRRK